VYGLFVTPSNHEVWQPVEPLAGRYMVFRTFNSSDALFAIDIAKGTKTLDNLVAERVGFRLVDNAI